MQVRPASPPSEAASHARSAGDIVGRDPELAVVRSTFRAAGDGRPSVVLLIGEAGIGKTRLADEAASIARSAGMRVVRGQAEPSVRQPMGLWHGVSRALRAEPADDPTLRIEDRRWAHLETLADALTAAAPVVVVLDDLHWADPVAVWVLEHLPRAIGDASVAVIAASRDHEPDMPALDGVRRVSRVIQLGGLDIEAVQQLAVDETPASAGAVDPIDLMARTGGNPLFVQELVRSAGSGIVDGVIGQVLQRSLDRFDADSRLLLATAAVAGPGTPLSVLAGACSSSTPAATTRLQEALRGGVLDAVEAAGVRFHHALLADAAARLGEPAEIHHRLALAWHSVGGAEGRAAETSHRLRSGPSPAVLADTIGRSRAVAAELISAGHSARAASLLAEAREAGAESTGLRELRAEVALDLADVLTRLGDLEPASAYYQEAAELAHGSPDPRIRARAEIGANLWASNFVPDLPRIRRLEDALDSLPPEERHLRARLLGRLTTVGGADVDATERVRAWAAEAVAVARSTGDPVLIAQSLLDQTMSPTDRAAFDASIAATDEIIRLAERAGRTDLALAGHQRRANYRLNQGDLGGASQALGRAEVLAALLPGPWWRYATLLQRTTLHAVSGSRSAAVASMNEAVRVGTGHVEPVVVVGCEALHQLMLLDLYGVAEPRTEEVHRVTMQMLKDIPSPVFQVQKGFAAQLFGDLPTVQDMLHRFGSHPELLLRSMTGDHLLRDFCDTVARAGERAYAAAAYRALLPYTGLLNVGGGHMAGLPVDDVLGRLAALDGDYSTAVRHARDAVALARSMPSPPLLVHCLDHLADAIEQAGTGDAVGLRAEADALATASGVVRPGRPVEARRAAAATSGSASMRRDGPMWALSSPLGHARLPASNGLAHLARLLTTPGVEVAAVELAGQEPAPIGADLGPGLDAKAKREYRQRLHRLQTEIDDAEAAHDPVRAEHAHIEMEALLRELKRAVGLGGRDRPTGSDAERSRINVSRSLRRTVAAIGQQAPLLGAHLDTSIRTGRFCLYLPEPGTGLSWSVPTRANPTAASNGR